MEIYRVGPKLEVIQGPLAPGDRALVLLTTQEMEHPPQLTGLDPPHPLSPRRQRMPGGGTPRLFERDSDYAAAHQSRAPDCFWIFADSGFAGAV